MKGGNHALRAVETLAPAGQEQPAQLLRIDIGCGRTKVDGWDGIDSIDFGQKHVHDVRKGMKFLKANSVDEAKSSHFVEHLTGAERVPFFNELWRVLKVGAVAQIVTPCWKHSCAYGDPTHQWPPMSQWYPLYLHKEWRDANAPHTQFTCHFDHVIAGSWDPAFELKNPEQKQFAMNHYLDGFRDLIVTLTKRELPGGNG